MPVRRTLRPLVAVLFFVAASPAFAGADAAAWNPARTTAPDDVQELKALQAAVKKVVEKVTPATVAILQPPGAGSGVIVSEDGLVLTAAHVIEPSAGPRRRGRDDADGTAGQTVRLILANGKMVKGKVLGRNPKVDSGMVQITDPVPKDADWPGAKDGKWPFVPVGESAALQKGQWVVSLGHPGGPKPDRRAPVRVGQVVRSLAKDKVVVTDCTLVGGDSGGPLFDLTGKVVGIHSRIGMFLEDNIHVPTQAFRDDWKQLTRGDVIGRDPIAFMGVVLNWAGDHEPKIASVREGGPADKAGLKAGDLILQVNGERVHQSDDVNQILSGYTPGQTVTLEVQRGDEILEVKVKLVRRSELPEPKNADKP